MRLLARTFLPALLMLALGRFTWGQVSTSRAAEVSQAENPRLVVLETFMRPG